MQLGASEILSAANGISDRNERIQYLRKMGIKPLLQILKYALDPEIKWLVRGPLPPFVKNIYPGQETLLLAEARRLYLFVEGGHPTLTQRKREVLFVQFLEMLSKEDVVIIDFAKEKQLPYPNLTEDVILEAFPGLWTPAPKEEASTEDESEDDKQEDTENIEETEKEPEPVIEPTGDENLDAVVKTVAKAKAKAAKDTKAPKKTAKKKETK